MAPLLALGSKSTSLGAGTHLWVQAVRYDLFSSAVFLPYFSMLTLSLPLLGLGFKSTSFSPGFCVCRTRQYNLICWELNLISGFFAFSWLIIWADKIKKCGWCLAGGRGMLTLGPAPDFKCKLNISSFLTLPRLLDYIICTRNSVSIVLLLWMISGWLIHIRVWVEGEGVVITS